MSNPIETMLDSVVWSPIDLMDDVEKDGLPYVTHEGVLLLPNLPIIKVYQLSDGKRVISEDDLVKFFDTFSGW